MNFDMKELVCRVCLSNGKLVSLFGGELETPLSVKIMFCTSVNIEPNDNLPSKICHICLDRLNTSYKFKIQCEESDRKLRSQKTLHKDEYLSKIENQISKINKKAKNKSRKKSVVKSVDTKCDLDKETSGSKNVNGIKKHQFLSSECEVKEECRINNDAFSDDCSQGNNFDESVEQKIVEDEKIQNGRNDKKQHKEQCSTCGKVMSTRFRLRMHMRIHTGERPHSCGVCGRSFTLAQSLKVHIRTHSGEKPLVCTVCGRAFAQYSGLAAHSRIHTGALPYHCYVCGQNFRTTGHLQYHIRKHTGEKNFECPVCHRAFIMRADLTQHLKIHSGEKRYVCPLCGMRMTRSSHLTRHMLTHSKEKSHVCDICGASFTQKSDRVKHEKRHSVVDIKSAQTSTAPNNISAAIESNDLGSNHEDNHCDNR